MFCILNDTSQTCHSVSNGHCRHLFHLLPGCYILFFLDLPLFYSMTKDQKLAHLKVKCLPLSCRIKAKLICVVSEVLIHSPPSLLCICKLLVFMQKTQSFFAVLFEMTSAAMTSGSALFVCPKYSVNTVSLPCFVCFHQCKPLFSLLRHLISTSSRTLKSEDTLIDYTNSVSVGFGTA